MPVFRALLALLLLGTLPALAAPPAAPAPRIDPTYWFVGMKNPRLQLLVHSPGIGNRRGVSVSTFPSTPAKPVSYPGVTVESVQALENSNYLLVNLYLGADTKPGKLRLYFTDIARIRDKSYPPVEAIYELRPRNADPQRHQGITQADFIYLLMPDRFANGDVKNDIIQGTRAPRMARDSMYARHGGDIKGMADHLGYLKQLGVTTVWPTPLIENDMPKASYHGYAVTDCYKIDPRYGTNAEYVQFVKTAHSQGLKVMHDIVLNHWGTYHHLFLDKPARDWFHEWPTFTRSNYNAFAVNDPHGSAYDKKKQNEGWFDTTMNDVNQANPLVATYMIQNFIWWIESTGLDAYRIDTYPYSNPQFLMAFGQAIEAEYPKFFMTGENWVGTTAEQAFYTQNIFPPVDGFKSNLPSTLDFVVDFAMNDALKDSNLNKLYETVQGDWMYQDATRNVTFLDNHDASRFYSVIGEDFAKYKIGLAWLLTMRGTPQLYYGTEVLMKNFSDPDGKVREDFPGGWNGDKNNYFVSRPGQAGEAFDYVSKLASYRKSHPVLSSGKLMQFIPQDGVYTYFRYTDAGCVMVMANVGKEEKTVDGSRFAERTAGYSSGVDVVTGAAVALDKLRVPAKTCWVVELKR